MNERIPIYGDGITTEQAFWMGCQNLRRGNLCIVDPRLPGLYFPMTPAAARAADKAMLQ